MSNKNLKLIAIRYSSPESVTSLDTAKLEELFDALDMDNPLKRMAYAVQGVPADLFAKIEVIRKSVISEIKRRDGLAKFEFTGTNLPRLQKVHIADNRKTNIMRIIDALYELKYFQDSNGLALSRDKIFSSFGELFEGGLDDFSQALSQSYSYTSEDTNTAVFDKMRGKIVEKIAETQERAEKK